ncbi:MAG: carboxypeptidase-like regulatory domain-containing protein [Flavobacteriaceae bacterium]
MKKIIFTLCIALASNLTLFAQDAVIKGRVVDTHSSEVISEIGVRILSSNFHTETDSEGLFNLTGADFPQGEQVLVVSKLNYITQSIPITIQNGETINLDPIIMEIDLTELESQIGVISLSDGELDGDLGGSASNVSGLLQASRDVFLSAAAFDFSATFFRPRGLDNAYGKVLINGIEMNKQFNGRPQWGDWGGLNDVQRNREFSMGIKANDYTFGDLAGTTNIIMRASKNRKNGRVSFAAANRSYQGRMMASYSSGVSKTGWAYSFLAARRFGNEGYIDGTLYDANSFYASVEKKINDAHSINFTGFYTPNRRGRSTAITQEVKDLKGIRYNPNWGYQDGEKRNSRVRNIKEPVFMLNHYWNVNEKININTNVAYQTGSIGNTRVDYGGTRLVIIDGQETYIGGGRNPFGNYYQRLPSYFLQDPNPTPGDFQNAYLAGQEFIANGQLDWESLYRGNSISANNGGNSIYAIQEDRIDDTQFSINSIFDIAVNENVLINGNINYRNLKSENFAELKDLLGGTGFLDVDFFAEGEDGNVDIIVGDVAQSDLRNRNRIVTEGDRYKYNYEINSSVISGFAQAQFKYSKVDFYLAASVANTDYQRNGLYENGNYPGARSFGESEQLSFTDYGVKGGLTYKITGRHLIDVNLGYLTKAPAIRNSFTNARQNNDVTIGLDSEKIQNIDIGYIFRSPIIKARITGFYSNFKDGNDLGFYFTENISGLGLEQDAFIQETLTNVEKQHIGVEFGIEAQVTPTIKVKGAASLGQYTYNNNPNLYITSDDLEGPITFGDGTTKLKDYHVAGGPEKAFQIGLEYRDPKFWWFGLTTNYFSNAYIDVNNLARSDNFSSDFDGQPFNDYDEEEARNLLKQEEFNDYFLVNIVGGKSWKIKKYYVGFFATINNVLDQEYITGGFEQGRKTNYRDLKEDKSRENGAVFGPRYFFGYGTSYYVNVYVRF